MSDSDSSSVMLTSRMWVFRHDHRWRASLHGMYNLLCWPSFDDRSPSRMSLYKNRTIAVDNREHYMNMTMEVSCKFCWEVSHRFMLSNNAVTLLPLSLSSLKVLNCWTLDTTSCPVPDCQSKHLLEQNRHSRKVFCIKGSQEIQFDKFVWRSYSIWTIFWNWPTS